MDCKEFANLLDRIIDNNITAQEDSLYKEHISKCPSCADEFQEILEVNNALEELSKQELPVNFTAQVVNRAKREGLITTKPKKITILSKLAMAVASFLFLFLLLDYTILPFNTEHENLRSQDFNIQQHGEEILESKNFAIESLGEVDNKKGLRNTMVLVSAIVLSSPFIIEVYKRKKTY